MTDAEFTIRSATSNDVPTLLALIRGLAEYERMADRVVASESSLRESLFGESPAAYALLGFAGAEAVAMAIYFHNYSTFLARRGVYLEDLFVQPQWRGRGYGRRLLAAVARIAVDGGCGRMEWSVLDWNQPALDFYRRLGAECLQEWRVHRLSGEALTSLARDAADAS